MLDFDLINRHALASAKSILESWIPGGNWRGDEYVVRNPTRPDRTAGSFSVNSTSGVWCDFAGDDQDRGGDLVSLFAYINGINQGEAGKQMAESFGIRTETTPLPLPPPLPKQKKSSEWIPVMPVPGDAPPPPRAFPRKEDGAWVEHLITASWTYRSATGELLGYIGRIEYSDPQNPKKTVKEIVPITFCERSDRREWRFLSFPEPRPLYNWDLLAKHPDRLVIGVEGEKCAQKLQELFDGERVEITVTTWPGGCKSVKKADWSILKGRDVTYWPDADKQAYPENHVKAGKIKPKSEQPGYSAAIQIADLLTGVAASIRILDPPDDKKPGWDVADAIDDGWSVLQIRQFIEARARAYPPPSAPDAVEEPSALDIFDSAPFRCLGYDGDYYYYLPAGTRQVKAIKGEGHTPAALMTVAPLGWWAQHFRFDGDINWKRAADRVLREGERSGVYDPTRRRGRGAWWDRDRIVVHLGNELLVNSARTEITRIDSHYIYEAGLRIPDDLLSPLTADRASQLLEICKSLHWENPLHGYFVAGWCTIAPICGAMYWRPHIWITGPVRAGKSWVLTNIVKPCLGPWTIFVSSDSTSAGIRQTLRSDAIPVMFDEAEGEDPTAQKRIQNVLELMRQSSFETGAKITKGTQGGRAMEFEIRSMFCLSSIGVNIAQHADETRILIASLSIPRHLTKERREAHFEGINNMVTATITPEWCAAFRARSISMIPTIRANSLMFARVVAERLDNRRTGDQIGALLAGAFALVSDKTVSLDYARRWFDDHDWSEVADQGTPDEQRLLDLIMQYRVRVTPAVERSVGEMLEMLSKTDQDPAFGLPQADQDADDTLRRLGIRFDRAEKMVWISDSHEAVRQMLKDSPWPRTWARLLRRLPDSQQKRQMRFLGTTTRATGLPWSVMMPEG